MDLREKLREGKRQLENGEINENEYNKRKKLLLNEWTNESKKTKVEPDNESKKTKKIEPVHGKVAKIVLP